MLYRELLASELENQRDDFKRFALEQTKDLTEYLEKLSRFCRKSYTEIVALLEGAENCGAVPSQEFEEARRFSVSFNQSWNNHEEARAWAFEILRNRTTFAADGSQLFAEREVSLPVAAIQIGWFENPHNDGVGYEKQAHFFVLPPNELLSQDEPVIPETKVGQRRFEAEIERIKTFLKKKQGWQERGERMPLAFYDGTLLLSISLPKTDLQEGFINKLVELVRVSELTEVPLVGYVDRSYARDLLSLLNTFDGAARPTNQQTLDDVSVLHASTAESAQTLKNWGDRTIFCYSKRRGLNAFINAETGKSIVGFTYLQTTSDSAPARLDVPAWIYEKGLLDEVADTVRAECVVGLGYPYALETADQTAVITVRDREIFLRTLQDFAMREKLSFGVSRKAASKGRRR
ncbi:MAG TPA: DNA double-strand break repair nuclease NurA [Pyrinomonadaceae bacterium]|jgi:hypothetical protein